MILQMLLHSAPVCQMYTPALGFTSTIHLRILTHQALMHGIRAVNKLSTTCDPISGEFQGMSSCLSRAASVFATWPHLANLTTMAYCTIYMSRRQYPGACHQNCIHVRHVNTEAEVAGLFLAYIPCINLRKNHQYYIYCLHPSRIQILMNKHERILTCMSIG